MIDNIKKIICIMLASIGVVIGILFIGASVEIINEFGGNTPFSCYLLLWFGVFIILSMLWLIFDNER